MKKSLILATLGLAAGASMTFGQGTIAFNSYNASHLGSSGIITTFGAGVAGHTAGTGLTTGWTAGLLYSLTPISDAATTDSTSAALALNSNFSVASTTAVFGQGLTPAGFFQAPDFSLVGGTQGQTVYFEVIAYQTGSTYANSTVRGHSAAFTGVLNVAPNQAVNMDFAPFQVFTAVPEPSTLALAGLGLAALVAYRRKQA